jgi:glycine cleavage system H protein
MLSWKSGAGRLARAAFGACLAVGFAQAAAAEVYMPIDGEVNEVNNDLKAKPESVNKDPYGVAWLAKIKITNPSQLDALMDAATYEKYCKERAA